ncbi:het nwd2 [Fusarium albosuccineum]|uniref:Het nwd2 n=1 Tax=Fusarium albosuccineum TaxID=1237068 RepID=A0A8H4P8A6_9HYPO|nr:het nwd2 [Fusarium albosuccineum]
MSVSPSRGELQVRIDAAVQKAEGTEPLSAFFSNWDEFADDYEALIIGMQATLKNDLVAKGIQATVSGRVKSEDSIKKSIERRKSRGEKYQNLGDIFEGMHDLAGFRIVVDYPSGIPEAENVVQQFVVVGKSDFSSNRDLGLDWTPIFGSFKSMNYRVKINRGKGDQLYRFRDVLVEIQVLSLAESLYNRLAHPLIYKKASGELSVKDQKIIDISHGLSLCYWICLSCMEENLGENQTIPRAVRQAGGGTEGVLPKLAAATPLPPSSSGTIPIKTLLDFIRTNQEQKDKSPDKLCQQLGTITGREAQAINHHSGSGHNINNFGSTTQQFGPSTTNHGPISNYYRSDPSNSETPKHSP